MVKEEAIPAGHVIITQKRTPMHIKNKLILLIFIIIVSINGTLYAGDSISITYIANCGFLVEIDSSKVIFDGLFKRGHNLYPTPDESTQKLLVSNQAPFNDIDLIFVSHTHEDHFDSGMLGECMLNNPTVKLVCPQAVIDSLNQNEAVYNLIKPRIIECTPDTFTSHSIQVDNIEIQVCRMAHPGKKYYNVQNNAYLITCNGNSVFHSSDADPQHVHKYRGIKLNELSIDICFLNEDFSKIENSGLAKEFINASYNIAMHLPDSVARAWLDSFKTRPETFSNPFIFAEKMEKKVFYINPKE